MKNNNQSTRPFSLTTFSLLSVALISLLATGCNLSFSMVDGYTFDQTGEIAESVDSGSFSAGLTELKVENKFGNIEIATTDGEPGWSWNKKVWGETQEMADIFLDQVILDVQTNGSTQTMTLVLPEPDSDFNGLDSKLILKVPAGIKTKLINAHGDTAASNLDGDFELESRHGNVSLREMAGSIEAKNAHGDLTAKNTGRAILKVSHGNADISDATGSVEIESSHGTVEAESIAGDVDIEGSHSTLKLTNISGNVSTKTSHARTKIDTTGQSVIATSSHGNIEVSIANSDFRSIEISTSHANIDLSLPSNSSPNIDMNTTHGSKNSEFESTDGSQPVKLRSSHGDIRVKKSESAFEVTQ